MSNSGRTAFRYSDGVAALCGLLVAAVILLAGTLGGGTLEESRQADILRETRQLMASVAENVATDIGRALDHGIPLADIYGLEAYLTAVAEANGEVAGIVVLDAAGQPLARGGVPAAGGETLVEAPILLGEQTAASVQVTATQRLALAGARDRLLILLATALLGGALAAVVLRLTLLERSDLPLARLGASLKAVGRGGFTDYTSHERPGPVLQLAQAATRLIAPLRQGRRQLQAAARELGSMDLPLAAHAAIEKALAGLEAPYRYEGGDRGRRVRDWPGWWLVAAAMLGEGIRPLIAGFAADRAPDPALEGGRIALTFAAQALAMLLGLVLAWRLRGGRALAGLALAVSGFVTLTVEWQYSGGLFLATRIIGGLTLALGVGTLALAQGRRLRRPWLGLACLAGLIACGPPLGSLLGELLGRRLAFATLGGGLTLLGLLLLLTSGRIGTARAPAAATPLRPALALGLAVLVLNGWFFGSLAGFALRYDYSLMALLLTVLGSAALLAQLPRPGLPPLLAGLLVACAPGAALLGGGEALLLAGAALAGLGLGFLWRGATLTLPAAALAVAAAQGLGPLAAVAEAWLGWPPGAGLTALALLGSAALPLLPAVRLKARGA